MYMQIQDEASLKERGIYLWKRRMLFLCNISAGGSGSKNRLLIPRKKYLVR